jgi:hypothetical protein
VRIYFKIRIFDAELREGMRDGINGMVKRV